MTTTKTTSTTSESEGNEAAATTMVIKVEREKVAACMTCPICNGLFTDATTISECLHTFCRKCIRDKITGETLYQCPVCNINLGGAPIEKLRADHSLQVLRAKIFCQTVPEAEAHALLSSGRRIKERSICSLVLGCKSSKVSVNCQGRKRTTPVSIGKKKLKISCQREEPDGEKADLLRPLISLVDASSKSEPKKSVLQEADDQVEQPDVGSDEVQAPKETIKERRGNETGEVTQDLNMPARIAVDSESKSGERFCPIWFSLIASNNQRGVPPLPQISSCYLRVKDGRLPVSTIKKYLVQKLGLASDAEVEIWLQGQPVVPTLQLHNLVDWWLRTTPADSERTNVTVGSSAKEFVMVLLYGRKTRPS